MRLSRRHRRIHRRQPKCTGQHTRPRRMRTPITSRHSTQPIPCSPSTLIRHRRPRTSRTIRRLRLLPTDHIRQSCSHPQSRSTRRAAIPATALRHHHQHTHLLRLLHRLLTNPHRAIIHNPRVTILHLLHHRQLFPHHLVTICPHHLLLPIIPLLFRLISPHPRPLTLTQFVPNTLARM